MATLTVAVVGAGPAGATAARILASRGARVYLLEARPLPRQKICGGGLTPKAQRLVPSAALDKVARRVHRVELRGGRLRPVHLAASEAEIAMVDRASFDMALAEAAARAGAEIRDGERVDGLTEDEHGVTITTRLGHLRADVVVAADGEPSAMARRLKLGSPAVRRSLALDVDLPLATSLAEDTAILSLTVAGGYAWYFPKGDHANLGVVSSRVSQEGTVAYERLREALGRLAADVGLDAEEGHTTGHWIPQALRRGRLASPRAVLVGDAAATADPLFGEGISFAIVSGVVASEVITDMAAGRASDLRPYEARLREILRPSMRRLTLAAAVAERSATLALAAVRLSPWVRQFAVDVVAGDQSPFALDASLFGAHASAGPDTMS